MKRHPVLQDLSRDHHAALVLARKLQYVDADSAGAGRAAFTKSWHCSGERHFRIEEEVLLPALANAGGAKEAIVSRVLHEHAEIRLQALLVQSRLLSVGLQAKLGKLLVDHVRLEERELFPLVEATLSSEALDRLALAMARAEGGS